MAKPSLPLDKYVGTFVDSAYGTIVIGVASGALTARYDKLDLGGLDHWDYDVFRSRPKTALANPVPLAFQPDGNGGVSSVRVLGTTFVRSRVMP